MGAKKIINNLQFPRLFGGELKIPKIQRISHSFVPKQHCGFQPAKGSRLFEKFLRNVAVPPEPWGETKLRETGVNCYTWMLMMLVAKQRFAVAGESIALI